MKHIIAAAIAATIAAPALAGPCAPRTSVIEQLADKYGEARQSAALSANGNMVEIFVNEEAGSWTAIETTPDGMSCLVSFGTAFEWINSTLPIGDPTYFYRKQNRTGAQNDTQGLSFW